MKTQCRDLPNGLRLVVARNMALNSVVVMAGVKVGSRHEPDGLHGAAHFAEHMFFKGTKKWPSAGKLSTVLDERGGEHNAYTDKEMTTFHARVAKPDAPVAVRVIHDMLANALFRSSDIEKERPVIREEISTYDNDPEANVWELSERLAYSGTGLAHRVTGDVDDVSFTPAALRRFLQLYYVPSRTVVVLAGAVDARVVASAEATFGSMAHRPFLGADDPRRAGSFKAGHAFQVGQTDRLHVVVRFPGVQSARPEADPLELLGLILGGYVSARLFQSLREDKSLCYGINSMLHGYSDTGSMLVTTAIDRSKLGAAMKAILKEVRSLRTHGVTARELAVAKTHRRGTQLIELERPMSVATYVVSQLFTEGKYVAPEQKLARLMAVTRDQINEASRTYLDPSAAHVAVVGPGSARKEVLRTLGSA
jgi:predicted Zn-dependent peptidase